jgi:hypothetical protein
MSNESQLLHFLVGHFDPRAVFLSDQASGHCQALLCLRAPDVVQDRTIAVERAGRPFLTDFAEEPVFDDIPLGCTGGIVTDRNRDAVSVAQVGLDAFLPEMASRAVTSTAVGQDQQPAHTRVSPPSFGAPPSADAFDGELRRIVRGPIENRSAVRCRIVYPIRNRHSHSRGAEVVVVHQERAFAPGNAAVVELPNEFLLLRINADDWIPCSGESLSSSGDVEHLFVPIRCGGRGDRLAVGVQRVVHSAQQPTHRIRAHLNARRTKRFSDTAQRFPGPFQPRHRISGSLVFHQLFDTRDHLGRFFPTDLRPAPALRIRAGSKSLANNCSRRPGPRYEHRSQETPRLSDLARTPV